MDFSIMLQIFPRASRTGDNFLTCPGPSLFLVSAKTVIKA